jgi:hypothetical protein
MATGNYFLNRTFHTKHIHVLVDISHNAIKTMTSKIQNFRKRIVLNMVTIDKDGMPKKDARIVYLKLDLLLNHVAELPFKNHLVFMFLCK